MEFTAENVKAKMKEEGIVPFALFTLSVKDSVTVSNPRLASPKYIDTSFLRMVESADSRVTYQSLLALWLDGMLVMHKVVTEVTPDVASDVPGQILNSPISVRVQTEQERIDSIFAKLGYSDVAPQAPQAPTPQERIDAMMIPAAPESTQNLVDSMMFNHPDETALVATIADLTGRLADAEARIEELEAEVASLNSEMIINL